MKIQVITMSLLLFVTNSFAQGNRFECDESCDPTSSGVAKFNVVSPVGLSTMEQIEMAQFALPSWVRILCITSHTPN